MKCYFFCTCSTTIGSDKHCVAAEFLNSLVLGKLLLTLEMR